MLPQKIQVVSNEKGIVGFGENEKINRQKRIIRMAAHNKKVFMFGLLEAKGEKR